MHAYGESNVPTQSITYILQKLIKHSHIKILRRASDHKTATEKLLRRAAK